VNTCDASYRLYDQLALIGLHWGHSLLTFKFVIYEAKPSNRHEDYKKIKSASGFLS